MRFGFTGQDFEFRTQAGFYQGLAQVFPKVCVRGPSCPVVHGKEGQPTGPRGDRYLSADGADLSADPVPLDGVSEFSPDGDNDPTLRVGT